MICTRFYACTGRLAYTQAAPPVAAIDFMLREVLRLPPAYVLQRSVRVRVRSGGGCPYFLSDLLYHVSKWALRARQSYTGPRLPWDSRIDKSITAHAQPKVQANYPAYILHKMVRASKERRSGQDVEEARHNAAHTALLKCTAIAGLARA